MNKFAATIICVDDEDEIAFALVKMEKQAKETGRLIWMFSQQGFFWMTTEYPENYKVVAKAYPGGRTRLRRHYYGN